jgi:hypothetical protein
MFELANLPAAANDNKRFDLTWFDDIAEGEPREMVIQGAFGVGETSTVSGLPGSGKSVVITDAACHVAAGLEWHGRKVRRGLVVYVAAERKKLTERRMSAFRKRYAVRDVPLIVLGGRIDLTKGLTDARALATAIIEASDACDQPCVWVVVDTLTRTFGAGDQNTSKDMSAFVGSIDEIVRLTGAHVTVVHHTAWSGERGKGAIDLDGAVDTSFIVKKASKGAYAFECNGSNDGDSEGVILNFTMDSVQVGFDSNGEPTTAPIVVDAGPGPAEVLLSAIRGHAAKVLDSLRSAVGKDGTMSDGDHFPADTLMVTEDQWRASYYETDAGAKPDTIAKRFKRARADLLASGDVNNLGQFYWPA